mmetsp:Transcript_47346/g.120836  ORF Transcript_47346/g.120836 Transcript_47346/m.120836 type:complete len:236 (-) Transcript_47346:829-1536(-)
MAPASGLLAPPLRSDTQGPSPLVEQKMLHPHCERRAPAEITLRLTFQLYSWEDRSLHLHLHCPLQHLLGEGRVQPVSPPRREKRGSSSAAPTCAPSTSPGGCLTCAELIHALQLDRLEKDALALDIWRLTRLAYAPPRATSSWCVPDSATAPLFTTMMRLASCTVLSLCAMTMVVRPLITRSSASWTMYSESASNALVASSRRRMLGLRTRARAMAMRCFCPPDSCTPFSPQLVW